MTMLFDPVPRALLSARGNYFRAVLGAIGDAAARTIEAAGRICQVFAITLLRWQMRRVLHSLSDCLLTEAGIRRSEIDTFVAELFPHRG
jgi:uncharacterized protein YjiS (DUF1127 family)